MAELAEGFRDMAFSVFDPVKAYRHYLSMARGQRRTYLMGETVRQKKYFYAVRPLLACQYLLAERNVVPMRFFIAKPNESYHVPLIVTPFGYTVHG